MAGVGSGTPPQAFASPMAGSPSPGGALQQMGPGFAVGGGGLIDTRAVGKLHMFSGKEGDWPPLGIRCSMR